jgi:hypothetical protein
MSAKICWCCNDNLAWEEYDGDFLGEDGEKPCYDCAVEEDYQLNCDETKGVCNCGLCGRR